MRDIYRLPDGATTKLAKKYIRAWRELASPIVDRMDYKLHSFDPDLCFRRPDGSTFTIPMDIALLIKELYARPEPEYNDW